MVSQERCVDSFLGDEKMTIEYEVTEQDAAIHEMGGPRCYATCWLNANASSDC